MVLENVAMLLGSLICIQCSVMGQSKGKRRRRSVSNVFISPSEAADSSCQRDCFVVSFFFCFFSVAHFCVIETLVSFAICGRSWPARRSESGRPFPRVAKGWPDRSDREPISGRGIVARLVIQVDPRSERRPSAGRQNGRPEPPGRPMRPRRPQRRRFGCGFEIVARYLAATDRDDDRLVIG